MKQIESKSALPTENILFITLGDHFRTLTKFLDLWREAKENHMGPINQVFAFTTQFSANRPGNKKIKRSFSEERETLRDELKKDFPPSLNLDSDIHFFTPKNSLGEEILDFEVPEEIAAFQKMVFNCIADEQRKRFEQERQSHRFIFSPVGGFKTMASDLMLASAFFAVNGDLVLHLITRDDHANSYHLHPEGFPGRPSPEGKKEIRSFFVEYSTPSLWGMFNELSKAQIFDRGKLDQFNVYVSPVIEALAGSTAHAFRLIHHIENTDLRGSLIQAVAYWLTEKEIEPQIALTSSFDHPVIGRFSVRTALLAAILQLVDVCDVKQSRLLLDLKTKEERNARAMKQVLAHLKAELALVAIKEKTQDLAEWQHFSVERALEKAPALIHPSFPEQVRALAEELKTMGEQYHNHFLLHSASKGVKIEIGKICIEETPSTTAQNAELKALYRRLIRKAIKGDLELTLPILQTAGIKFLHIDTGNPQDQLEDVYKFKIGMGRRGSFENEIKNLKELAGFQLSDEFENQRITDWYFDSPKEFFKARKAVLRLREKVVFKGVSSNGLTKHSLMYKKYSSDGEKSICQEFETLVGKQDFKRFREHPQEFLETLHTFLSHDETPQTLELLCHLENDRQIFPFIRIDSSTFLKMNITIFLDKVQVFMMSGVKADENGFDELEVETELAVESASHAFCKELETRLCLERIHESKLQRARSCL